MPLPGNSESTESLQQSAAGMLIKIKWKLCSFCCSVFYVSFNSSRNAWSAFNIYVFFFTYIFLLIFIFVFVFVFVVVLQQFL